MNNPERRIAVFSGTRADYGLLFYLLKAIENDPALELQLIVSGSHLSPEFGSTIQQIESDGFVAAAKVDMLLSADSAVATAKSMGLGIIGLTDALDRLKPDILVIAGDRYEALAVCQCALLLHIPVFHLHGGELTYGAYDDSIRHAISKLSQYHGTSTETYRQRLIRMGEAPERVFTVGAPSLEALLNLQFLERSALLQELNLPQNADYLLISCHPETQDVGRSIALLENLLTVLSEYDSFYLVFTYPNADESGRRMIQRLLQFGELMGERVRLFKSLGQLRYLSAVKHAALVIGNSSSGVIEVPSFNIPSVNIGQRQAGRISAASVFHCDEATDSIRQTIAQALSFKNQDVENPYWHGAVSGRMIALLKTVELSCTKFFYDKLTEGPEQ
ncbi:UDP-N-acetylglucosamine 2-epimerase [Rheinheimera texasensis]|uniref:UDP-N-acetylglucosamine 2-epimerase n=1 Tax=Rheinheimera texasensis TaxID=306205 RepID=UPI0004E2147A|nr:UDP-N-acetylglucosamine 2-epimerase [Rheinheimera texasensis]